MYICLIGVNSNFTKYLTRLILQSCVSNRGGYANHFQTFQLPEVPQETLDFICHSRNLRTHISLCIDKNCTNSCLLSLLNTASVCAPPISTTCYDLTENKSIVLLTRQLAEKVIACNFFLCLCTLISILWLRLEALKMLSQSKSYKESHNHIL